MKLLRNEVTNDYLIDDVDRKIIHELSIGTRMKDLPNIVHLSITAIEKRKRLIKQTFGLTSTDDKDLILVARDKGFI